MLPFQQAVQRLCFTADNFSHALGCTAGWSSKQHLPAHCLEQLDNNPGGCRLSTAWSSGQHGKPVPDNTADGIHLTDRGHQAMANLMWRILGPSLARKSDDDR